MTIRDGRLLAFLAAAPDSPETVSLAVLFVEQARQALANFMAVLADADCTQLDLFELDATW